MGDVVRLELTDEANAEEVAAVLRLYPKVARVTVEKGEETKAERAPGLPTLEESSRVRLSWSGPEGAQLQTVGFTGRMGSMLRVLYRNGVMCDRKALWAALMKDAPADWVGSTPDAVSTYYNRLAEAFAYTPWPLIRAGSRKYGFKCQQAVTRRGRVSKRRRKLDEEV
jgi:hypothetical protein